VSDYWLRDETGGVLGPVSLGVIRDLAAAGRLGDMAQVSRDGTNFQAMHSLPELSQALSPASPRDREQEEARLAESALRDLQRFRGLNNAELFSVPRGAVMADFQRGFLELAKRYQPARLRPGTHPALVDAYRQVFAFLSDRMKKVEQELR
jgi:hypothetical protein